MATVMTTSIGQIGETAGLIWHTLNESGPISVSKLAKTVDDVPRDIIMQAIGWLAREDKIEIEETRRGRIISLRDPLESGRACREPDRRDYLAVSS